MVVTVQADATSHMKKLLALCALLIALPSCASMITGGTDDILVTSYPSGASFRTSLGTSGRTPRSIEVPDDKDLSVTFRLDGYEDASAVVGTRLSGWVLGNIIFGGVIGLVVDLAADGRVHTSDSIHADLVRVEGQEPSQQVGIPDPAEDTIESFDAWMARTQATHPD